MSNDVVEIGTVPPLGSVPDTMLAQTVRQDRYGDPKTAFKVEEIPTPKPSEGEVLIAVMAAGINYNNVWAARGIPIDVIGIRQRGGSPHDFHIGGSDAAGIVYDVGEGVTNVNIGDEVVIHPGWWNSNDPWVLAGKDPMMAPSAGIWGYDTNFGSFGQFAIAQEHQCVPKAPQLTWEEAAASTLVGTTAYRMMFGFPPNVVGPEDVVLVWGGSGGVGCQAIQLAKWAGATPIAVVSDDERGEYCVGLGAAGYINRSEFNHWGVPPHWTDDEGQARWVNEARRFGKAIWDILGERRNPTLVIEHPGEATIPTSGFVCEAGGMVAICAGTTGYTAVVDLRYHWVRQKRLQGSHGSNDEQAIGYNRLLHEGVIDPCATQVFSFDEIPQAHHEMGEGVKTIGNRVALVGAAQPGEGRE